MSDPLTALMHAAQIMNLLKTLITKTLREREEAATAAYSPMLSHSSDGEIESQREMDTSCELRGPLSQCDVNSPYRNGFRDGDEIESLSDMDECILGQFDEKENAKIPEESIGDLLRRHHVSARSGSTSYMQSGVSLSDSKFESSCLSTSDGEYSGACSIAVGVKDDLEMKNYMKTWTMILRWIKIRQQGIIRQARSSIVLFQILAFRNMT
ncbi:hypothetical protein RHMOL_Rhmol08G0246200 [Rhododendron molle]|uniref:Uncharacterized protein n=1 Tax=Rhododendron molle TaxID=49168 RepID=A0ACC0MTI3_RHOML|nr:hypothetical protein RHMOL_Rhmol08G0246200 [Rhododendron molle]